MVVAMGARSSRLRRSRPRFWCVFRVGGAQGDSATSLTVDADVVSQHYDTNLAARSLEHPPGTPETNNWHAVQIELVAYAAQVKPPALLARAARLARWIERTHAVPQQWPAGYPLGAV